MKHWNERLRAACKRAAEYCRQNRRLALTALLLLIGMLALLISAAQPEKQAASDKQSKTTISNEAYAQSVENRLTGLLSVMEGVGSVRVMVTVESGSEHYYLSDRDSGQASDAGGRSSADLREDHVIVRSGNEEQGILVKVSEPQIRGVAVVCSGGDDPAVQARVIDAVTALLHLSSAHVSVAKMDN